MGLNVVVVCVVSMMEEERERYYILSVNRQKLGFTASSHATPYVRRRSATWSGKIGLKVSAAITQSWSTIA